jgi:hypothetical protein
VNGGREGGEYRLRYPKKQTEVGVSAENFIILPRKEGFSFELCPVLDFFMNF